MVGPAIKAAAEAGSGGLLDLFPGFDIIAQLLRRLLGRQDDRLGEYLEEVKNTLLDRALPPPMRVAGLFTWHMIALEIFELMQSEEQFGALSYAVMDRKNYLDRSCEHNVDSVEVFFDARDSCLVAFVDALIAFEINQEVNHGRAFLGYVSLRFTGPTRALIGMQKHETTCAVEVAGLLDMSGSQDLIKYAERLALNPNIGGVLHWGQRNNATRAEIEALFGDSPGAPGGDLGLWRGVLDLITEGGRFDGFSSDFSRRIGLEL